MRSTIVAPLITVAVVMGACGTATPKPAAAPRDWSEADVRRLAGLVRNPDQTYRLSAHPDCVAPTMLRSEAEVESYKAAGDTVKTNPGGTVGLKVTGDSAACQRFFAQALARVR